MLKLDFSDMKTLVINKLNQEIVLVYIKTNDGRHAIQMLVNGFPVKQSIKPVLVEYAKYNGIEIDESKTTYQIFDEVCRHRYGN